MENRSKTKKNAVIIQKSYNLKSLNAYMSNTLDKNYVMFNPSYHEEYMVSEVCENILAYIKQR